MAQLSYADPVRLDPLPALRRIRALAIAWSLLVFTYAVIDPVLTLFWPIEGGWSAYRELPLWTYAQPLGAVFLALAVAVFGRIDHLRCSWLALVLASCAAAMQLALSVGRIVTYDAGPSALLLIGEFARFMLFAAVPMTLVWAAARPETLSAARLAGIAALMALIFASLETGSIGSLSQTHSIVSMQFWATVMSPGWVNVLAKIAAGFLAAVMFAVSARRLRRGGDSGSAIYASWLLIALVVWLCATSYGFWWNAPRNLNLWMRVPQIASSAIGLLIMLSGGLAFLAPVGRKASQATI